MPERSVEEILQAIQSYFEPLEIEAARLMILAKENQDEISAVSAARVYDAVRALSEEFEQFRRAAARA